jgi:hypothetical protein
LFTALPDGSVSEAIFLFTKFESSLPALHDSSDSVPNGLAVDGADGIDASGCLIALIVIPETGNELGISIDHEIGIVTHEDKLSQCLCRHDLVGYSLNLLVIEVFLRLVDKKRRSILRQQRLK